MNRVTKNPRQLNRTNSFRPLFKQVISNTITASKPQQAVVNVSTPKVEEQLKEEKVEVVVKEEEKLVQVVAETEIVEEDAETKEMKKTRKNRKNKQTLIKEENVMMDTAEKIALANEILDQKPKILKKDMGLIERTVSSRTILTEDNKELLHD